MATRNIWVFLTALVLLSSSVCMVWGQAASLGVKSGDTFVWSYNAEWQSNQTGVEQPASFGQGMLQFIASAIMSVDGVSVTANTSYCYSTGIEMEINSADYGGGYLPFYIPANLGVGDSVPRTNLENGPVGACYINNTLSPSSSSENRTTNHLQIWFPVDGFNNVQCNVYYDKATGVMTQITYNYTNQTGNTATTWSVNIKLTQTSLFAVSDSPSPSLNPSSTPSASGTTSPSVPEFPTSTALVATLVIITLTAATFAKSRKK